MKKTTLKMKFFSLLITLTMLIGMMPLSGIVSYAVGDDETCAHIDDDNNAKCDTCEGFLSEPEGEIFEDELVTKDLPVKNDGFIYFAFTPTATDEYAIVAVESENDPLMYLYNSDGTFVGYNDDHIGRLFRVVATLSAGVTYYIALADYGELSSCTFKVYATCDEHVPVGETTCLGTVCAVCGENYGDPGDHTPAGPADCRGILCSVCDKYYGTPTDHTPAGPANCHGILCSVCNSYYGTPTDHIPAGPANCIGIYCSVCRSYYGDVDPNYHMDYFKNDGRCDGCSIFAPNVQSTVTLKEIVTVDIPFYYDYIYATFTPEETRMYLFKSYETDKSYDPYLYIYDAEGNELFKDDDSGEGYQFYLEAELEAGVTYYLRLRERKDDLTCTFAIKPLCDEHIPSETVNCLGTLCSYCEEFFGESNDEHTPSETVNCLGTLCSTCGDYFGESGDHTLEGEMTCLGTMCSVCYDHFGETGDHKLEGEMTCLGTMCSVCYGYFGETGDHKLDGEMTCLGTMCSVCNDYFGEKGDHTPYGDANCKGYVCDVCWEYYGEPAYDHVDDNNDHRCDECDTILTDLVVTVGENDVSLIKEKKVYYKFVPTESGSYRFESFSSFDPKLFLYDENGQVLADADDIVGRNFYLEIELTGGEFYYLAIYEYNNDNICPIKITKLCDEHTPGEQTCLGYVCTVCGKYYGEVIDHATESEQTCYGYLCKWCGEYYGETGDHSFDDFSFDSDYHYGICVVCDGYYEMNHEYDANGDCVCGYFYHEHVSGEYQYDRAEHWIVCSLCGMESGEYGYHEYNEDGICICGREAFIDICLGDKIIVDGQYLDNEGNISTTAPEGGYAYYKDGVLTLNNFTLVNDHVENPVSGYHALYSETNLSLVLIGENHLEATGEDTIHIYYADLTIDGEGTLTVINHTFFDDMGEGYTSDGIDVNGGKLTVNSGNLIIESSDHGIEVYGDTEINGGTIRINAGDDGMDVDDIIINGGMFYIYAEDNGIDSGNSLTINGGSFYIETEDDDGIEAYDVLTINGGTFEMDVNDECLESVGTIIINGGYLDLDSSYGYSAIVAEGDLVINTDLGEYEVYFDDEYYYGYILVNSDDLSVASHPIVKSSEYEDKMLIKEEWLYVNPFVVLNATNLSNVVSVTDDVDRSLKEGVDYTVSLDTSSTGRQVVIITGIGNYVGTVFNTTVVVEPIEINYGEMVTTEIPSVILDNYSLFEFTPEIDATYIISTVSGLAPYILVYNSDLMMIAITPSDEDTFDVYFEIELKAGETYYFAVTAFLLEEVAGEGGFSIEIICPGHVGGEATYTEQAICDICEEHYGELRECPGHFGGEATYQESPICQECGLHYGDKLYCDHMCHKGGVYAIIWGIFEEIYDFFGIETECKCGEDH